MKGALGTTPLSLGVRQMAVALLTTERVESILRDAVTKGCYVEQSKADGTAKAYRDGDLAFQALQKGKGGPWICRFINTKHVTWTGSTVD
jgi:hypothetical protein